MRSHRQNCDVSDITSEQIACLAARSRAERLAWNAEQRKKRLSDGVCAIAMVIAICAGYGLARNADNDAEAAQTASVYAGMHHGRLVDHEALDQQVVAAPAPGCPVGGLQQ
jgi:hypothetical protein